MNILLDTHALWWFIKGDEKLPTSMQNVICDEANTIHVSLASIWEVAIKMSIGKLHFDGDIKGLMDAIQDEGFSLLEISTAHVQVIADLPFIHRDPFDRMLIAQAMVEQIPIMTADANVQQYDVGYIW